MASLLSTSEETQLKINRLNADEQHAIVSYLSRNPYFRNLQIGFLNGEETIGYQATKTSVNKSIAASEKNINPELVAKTIYDLGKIDSLTHTVAKTTIGATKFLDKQIDNLGSTILNAIDGITNAAEEGTKQIEETLQEWGNTITTKERKFLDKTVYPCTTWSGDVLKGLSGEFLEDVRVFNRFVANNRLLNTPGDMFNSVRHIAFALRGEIEKLIDFTHQMFAGLSAAVLKLKRKLKRIVKAITIFCLRLIEGLIPTNFLTDIATAVNQVIQAAGEIFHTLTNTILSTAEDSFKGLQEEVLKIAEHPLQYVFGQLGAEAFINFPGGDILKKLQKAENDIINNKLFTEFIKFSDKFTIENLIKMLPKGAQETYRILSEISSNAHAFIGNGIRNYARRKILKNRRSIFLGKLQSVGINFTLSAPYHFASASSYRAAPLITFKPLLTDNSGSIEVDKYGNRVSTNYYTYTATHLY